MIYKFLPEALIEIAPNKAFVINGDFELKNVTWNENVPKSDIPKDENIIKKCDELQAEYDANQYQRDRQPEYPSIQDQLDMQYWDKVNGSNNWQEAIEAVKTKHPKPEA